MDTTEWHVSLVQFKILKKLVKCSLARKAIKTATSPEAKTKAEKFYAKY